MSKKFYGEGLIGKTFGRLTVLAFSPCEDRRSYWLCECSCDKKTQRIFRDDALKSGHTESCGCLKEELFEQRNTKNLLDLTFGKLTVIEKTNKRKNDSIVWLCQCSCKEKTIKEVISRDLLRGHVSSCGCIDYSIGENNIKILLDKHNITYTTEQTFSGLVSPLNNKTLLPFDFAIYENDKLKYIIEFDGIQHTQIRFDDPIQFQRTQTNDIIKNEYCKINNIPLIRIPYTQRDCITIEMLKPATSQFLVNSPM